MRGSRRGGGPDPPWNLKSLISPILLGMKKIVIFHICALPQLYVKQIQSYFRLDPPPWKKFLDPRLGCMWVACKHDVFLSINLRNMTEFSVLSMFILPQTLTPPN